MNNRYYNTIQYELLNNKMPALKIDKYHEGILLYINDITTKQNECYIVATLHFGIRLLRNSNYNYLINGIWGCFKGISKVLQDKDYEQELSLSTIMYTSFGFWHDSETPVAILLPIPKTLSTLQQIQENKLEIRD